MTHQTIKKQKHYSNLNIYKLLCIKRNPITVTFKTEANNISNIYNNLINQPTIKSNT